MELGAKVSDEYFVRNKYIHPDDLNSINKFKTQYNNTALHKGVWIYNDINNIEDSLMYGDFYMDFDSHDNFEYVREDVIKTISIFRVIFFINDCNIKVFFSGKKGIHISIPAYIFGVTPHKNLDLIYKRIVTDINTYLKHKTPDTQIYHRRAMLRMEDTIHEASGVYKTRITIKELIHKSKDELLEIAKEGNRNIFNNKPAINMETKKKYTQYVEKIEEKLSRKDNTKHTKKLDHDPPCIEYLLNNTAPQGTRNHIISIISGHFRSRGYTYDESFNRLLEWNNAYCSPAMRNIDLKRTLQGMFSTEKQYGCTSLSLLGGCDKNKCKLVNKKGGAT